MGGVGGSVTVGFKESSTKKYARSVSTTTTLGVSLEQKVIIPGNVEFDASIIVKIGTISQPITGNTTDIRFYKEQVTDSTWDPKHKLFRREEEITVTIEGDAAFSTEIITNATPVTDNLMGRQRALLRGGGGGN